MCLSSHLVLHDSCFKWCIGQFSRDLKFIVQKCWLILSDFKLEFRNSGSVLVYKACEEVTFSPYITAVSCADLNYHIHFLLSPLGQSVKWSVFLRSLKSLVDVLYRLRLLIMLGLHLQHQHSCQHLWESPSKNLTGVAWKYTCPSFIIDHTYRETEMQSYSRMSLTACRCGLLRHKCSSYFKKPHIICSEELQRCFLG